jgi:hypothetical protein
MYEGAVVFIYVLIRSGGSAYRWWAWLLWSKMREVVMRMFMRIYRYSL